MNFIFSWSTRYLTRSLRSLVRYRVDHSKIKFVSTRGHVISSMSFVWFYQIVFLSKFAAFHPRTVKRIVTALMLRLLFRCFSLFLPHLRTLAQEKSRKLSSFWDWWLESLFLTIMVAKYLNIFPHANNGCSREKKFLAKRFAHAISARVHYRDLEHAYVY